MKLPKIGEIITVEDGLKLCKHFKLDYLVERLEKHPENYKEFRFDGCSCLPDELLGLFTGLNWKDITYKCCLPHDLKYAYGNCGLNWRNEKHEVDTKFYEDLLSIKMKDWCAKTFLTAVEVGGGKEFGFQFSWDLGICK